MALEKVTRSIKNWIALRTESCKSIVHLFSHSLDRKLTLVERIRLRIHMFTCTACPNYVSNLNFIHNVFQAQNETLETEDPPFTLSKDAAERIKQKLKQLDDLE